MGGPRIVYCLQAAGLGLLFVTVVSLSDRHVFPVTLNIQQNQSSPCSFPDSLHAEIKSVKPFPEFLVLHRKDVINTDAPAYVIKRRTNGAVYFSQTDSHRKESAAYQNSENGAAFLLKCTSTGPEIAGTLYIEGRKYRVSRAHAADKSQSAHNSARDPRGDYYEFLLVQDIPHNDQHVQAHVKRMTRGKQHGDPLLQGAHSLTVPRSRAKRETKDYFIDVLVALDFAFYKYWLGQADGNSTDAIQKAKEYIAYIFNGINSRFNSAKTADYNLHMTIGSFIIAQTAEDAPWTETVKERTASGITQLNASTVMTKLETYVKETYSNLPSHDHLMLITEYDLYGDDNGFRFNNTAGFALIGSMCYTDGTSISVVEDHGGFQSEGTATHELGHSMGAEHDGDGNECSSADRYVMAGNAHEQTEATKANPWLFSPCSVAYFKQLIHDLIRDGYESTCLLARVTADGVPTVSGLPGQLAGPDVQCRQIYGAQSYLCRWCSGGQCVSSDKANCYVSDTCPFGQREGPVYQNKTCEELDSAVCYDENFRQVCCLMCDNARTGVVGCEFGDPVMACDAKFCGRTVPSGELYDVECCGTCSFTPTTLTPIVTSPDTTPVTEAQSTENACRDTVLINGTETCPDFLDRAGVSSCCQSQIKDSCCKSCAARTSSEPLCPYGDCTNCKNVETRSVACSQSLRKSCCKTCNDVDERIKNQTASTTKAVPSSSSSKISTPLAASTTKAVPSSASSKISTPLAASTTKAVPSSASGKTSTPPATQTSQTTAKPVKECKPLLGVTTCGSAEMRRNVVVILLSLTLFAAFAS
ncbi:uncharacterized protein [Littorina saxatilis]|uniref:uncharacterized protein isoform X2 n=1 Tax=Littorina saxatilis TaxID=31220 RepID=UPI0038B66620